MKGEIRENIYFIIYFIAMCICFFAVDITTISGRFRLCCFLIGTVTFVFILYYKRNYKGLCMKITSTLMIAVGIILKCIGTIGPISFRCCSYSLITIGAVFLLYELIKRIVVDIDEFFDEL